jgi:transcriptional regulator with XRE-family HTH domain
VDSDVVETGEERSTEPARAEDEALSQPSLGRALRALRNGRGLSLAAVAAATGLSASFLSVVEKGQSDIAIGRLVRIAQFYGVRLADLITESADSSDLVVRRGTGARISSAKGVEIEILARETKGLMLPFLTTHEPHARSSELDIDDGEVFLYVLDGTVLLELQDSAPTMLQPGDSVYYEARRLAALTNLGASHARLVGALTSSRHDGLGVGRSAVRS